MEPEEIQKDKSSNDKFGFIEVFKEELKDVKKRREILFQDTKPGKAVGEDLPDFKIFLEKFSHKKTPVAKNLPEKDNPELQKKETQSKKPKSKKPWSLAAVILDLKDNKDQNQLWKKAKEKSLTLHSGLVGLALSGGGIRSATFNLGVIQALNKHGIFKHLDYLSTVSGGGYIGSCLSSYYASWSKPPQLFKKIVNWFKKLLPRKVFKEGPDKPEEGPSFPFTHTPGDEEKPPFLQLRNYSNYLAPKGLLDLLRLPSLMFRGILINFVIVLPYILAAAWITTWMIDKQVTFKNDVALKYSTLVEMGHVPKKDTVLTKEIFEGYHFKKIPLISQSFVNDFGKSFFLTKLLTVVLIFGFLLYPLIQRLAEKLNYFGKDPWEARNFTGKIAEVSISLVFLVAFIELQPKAITYLNLTIDTAQNAHLFSWLNQNLDLLKILGAILVFTASVFSSKFSEKISKASGKFGLYFLAALSFLLFWLLYLYLCRWAIVPESNPHWSSDIAERKEIYIYVGIGLLIYTSFFVDINQTSLHNFYRDRLSKAYLFQWNKDNNKNYIQHNDSQKLSDLNIEHAPYHLINAAINIKHAKEMFRTGRKADFFIFSKHAIGGKLTGYCRTKHMEKIRPHVNLGTAMAISGAAAAPNMGKTTIKPLVFILTMLNVRLNYWLPNPGLIKDEPTAYSPNKWTTRVGPFHLLLEIFGGLEADSWNINLSDGGHIENLGVFELLRRQCRLIIVGDAESDPNLKFEGLSEAIRLARVDLGIKIEMNGLDEIRNGRGYHAVGKVYYSDSRFGYLVYLKSSLRGDASVKSALSDTYYESSKLREDHWHYDGDLTYIAHYKALHPDFPHETTGDQFFDETQFECYRSLGYLVAKSSFENKEDKRDTKNKRANDFV